MSVCLFFLCVFQFLFFFKQNKKNEQKIPIEQTVP